MHGAPMSAMGGKRTLRGLSLPSNRGAAMKSHGYKLPRGRSYPLKPSELEREVVAAGLGIPVEFTRWDRFDNVFQASFHPEGTWPGKEGEFFWVYCRAVPSAHARDAKSKLLAEGIPKFLAWAKDIERLDERSPIRREKQTFRFALDDFA